MRRALTHSQRAQLYLHERGIPLQTALEAGVGYLPSTLFNRAEMGKQREVLCRWLNRLSSPDSLFGRGYIGRSLWHWQPGMNETIHKARSSGQEARGGGSRPTRRAGLAWSWSSYRTPSCSLRVLLIA